MKSPLFIQSLVELTYRNGVKNTLFELTLEQCEQLYSKGISVEKVKSIYPTHYKLTLEK